MKRDTRLTERDREIVSWIARLGAIEATHVRARFGTGRSVAYDRLSVLAAHGLVERITLLHRQPGLYVATREGRRWTETDHLGLCRVSPGAVRHWRLCGRAAVALEREFGSEHIRSDREIRAAERIAGRPLASAVIGDWPDGRPRLHRPDLAVLDDLLDTFELAIEVELTAKSSRRLEAICRGYGRNRSVRRVRYYAAPAAAKAVARAAERTYEDQLIEVRPLMELENPTWEEVAA